MDLSESAAVRGVSSALFREQPEQIRSNETNTMRLRMRFEYSTALPVIVFSNRDKSGNLEHRNRARGGADPAFGRLAGEEDRQTVSQSRRQEAARLHARCEVAAGKHDFHFGAGRR